MVNRREKSRNSDRLYNLGLPNQLMVTTALKLKDACSLKKKKTMTNLDSILKSRDITLPTKIFRAKAMFFPVVMRRCDGWNIKKAECQRIDVFEFCCWRRLLRVPWTARR